MWLGCDGRHSGAAGALMMISARSEERRVSIARQGAIQGLVSVLREGAPIARAFATGALLHLVEDSPPIAGQPGPAPSSGADTATAVAAAAAAAVGRTGLTDSTTSTASSTETVGLSFRRTDVAGAGAILPLVQQVRDGTAQGRADAVRPLLHLFGPFFAHFAAPYNLVRAVQYALRASRCSCVSGTGGIGC